MLNRQQTNVVTINDSDSSSLSTDDIAQIELAKLKDTVEVERQKLMNKYIAEENIRIIVEDALMSYERRASSDKKSGADDGTRPEASKMKRRMMKTRMIGGKW